MPQPQKSKASLRFDIPTLGCPRPKTKKRRTPSGTSPKKAALRLKCQNVERPDDCVVLQRERSGSLAFKHRRDKAFWRQKIVTSKVRSCDVCVTKIEGAGLWHCRCLTPKYFTPLAFWHKHVGAFQCFSTKTSCESSEPLNASQDNLPTGLRIECPRLCFRS